VFLLTLNNWTIKDATLFSGLLLYGAGWTQSPQLTLRQISRERDSAGVELVGNGIFLQPIRCLRSVMISPSGVWSTAPAKKTNFMHFKHDSTTRRWSNSLGLWISWNWKKITSRQTFVHIFAKYEPIFKFFHWYTLSKIAPHHTLTVFGHQVVQIAFVHLDLIVCSNNGTNN